MLNKEDLKTAVISFIIPLAGMYIFVTNRFKDPSKAQLALKSMINALAAALAAGLIGWMYYNIYKVM